ncbi:AraC family transcriptional regulator [Kribbella sp. NPDC050281]|uniref:helix-turn-helix transcriptional regulator n=1 Tax=Kribbella sp. NPDC050281 TaxID=3155515 RepID=UPI0033D8FD55
MATADPFTELDRLALSVAPAGQPAEMLAWGDVPPVPWRNEPHVHSYFEVCYAYAGEGVFTVADEQLTVSEGELFVARPGEPHQIVSSTRQPLGLRFWGFSVDGSTHRDLFTDFRESDVRIAPATPDVPRLLDLLAAEAGTPQPATYELLRILTEALLVASARRLVHSGGRPVALDGRGGHHSAQRMARFIDDNLGRPIGVGDVAAEVHLSERHAARLFLAAHGRPIRAYVRERRLERAAELLAGRAHSIKEVAHLCGYPDVRYFTTAFRFWAGLTPGAFRDTGGTVFT